MKKVLTFLTVVFFISGLLSFSIFSLPKDFDDSLKTAGMIFNHPKGFSETPVIENNLAKYQYAIKRNDKNLEVRFTVRPLQPFIKEYKDKIAVKHPVTKDDDPNTWYKRTLQTILLNISGGQSPDIREWNAKEAKKEFNADWVGISFVDVGRVFGQDYRACKVIMIHKHDMADAFYFFLSDTKENIESNGKTAARSLTFK